MRTPHQGIMAMVTTTKPKHGSKLLSSGYYWANLGHAVDYEGLVNGGEVRGRSGSFERGVWVFDGS